MLKSTDFVKFKTNVQKHLQTQAEQVQQHENLVREIRLASHHPVEQEPATIPVHISPLENTAVELGKACAQVSKSSTQLLKSSYEWLQADHDYLLRRTIAINLEFELKRQLFPALDSSSRQRLPSAWESLQQAKKINPHHASRISKEWFPSPKDQQNFFLAMQLLKSASSAVHPVNTIEGAPMTVSTSSALLQQDFKPVPTSSASLNGLQWDDEKKKLISHLVEQLGSVRAHNGQPQLLHKATQ
ncbi:hypothetical protein PGT21_033910 [Puccinia graminis f. sp. tritici]|uniref:Uncharacterized protein n=1 Tax=Puccinia graminis f. sp. tritici TaxID=56615 RepID=A0A5B0NFU2_PUCGR|nr:hypothetical protein PGT21_033910 [Puccinia graminis f. sp. tritici]